MKERLQRIGSWLSAHKPTKRRIIQLYAALLTNANLKGFGTGKIYEGSLKSLCVPGLNCYSCPGAAAACPLGALQNALASSGTRLPYYVFGILLLYGFLFGRWICGFLCPFGLIQDLLYKIKTPKIKKNQVTRILSYFKYVILAVFVIAIPLIYGLQAASIHVPAFCKYICPSGTLLGAGGLLSNEANDYMFGMLGPLFTWKFLLLIVFLVGAVLIYRFFCRFFCPLGALYGLFNRISLLGMKVDEPKCTKCGMCVGKCQMDIRHVGDHECISCGSCVNVCPTNAITFKGPKILLAPNEGGEPLKGTYKESFNALPKKTQTARLIVAGLMLVILATALFYYNVIDALPSSPNDPTENTSAIDPSGPSVGSNVGDLCYVMDLKLYGQDGTVSLEDSRGKITIVNFWATWCGPCVLELQNEFPLIAQEYGDQVAILAVHSSEVTEDVVSFAAKAFPNAPYVICADNNQDEYFFALGGSQSLPHSVIVDENGIILAVIPRATTYTELKNIIDSALNK